MKKHRLLFLAAAAGLFLTGMAARVLFEPTKATATVDFVQGVYVFTDSKPVLEYDYLGTVTIKRSPDPQYNGVRDKLIKTAKEQYPDAEGLIFTLRTGSVDMADAIKFK